MGGLNEPEMANEAAVSHGHPQHSSLGNRPTPCLKKFFFIVLPPSPAWNALIIIRALAAFLEHEVTGMHPRNCGVELEVV